MRDFLYPLISFRGKFGAPSSSLSNSLAVKQCGLAPIPMYKMPYSLLDVVLRCCPLSHYISYSKCKQSGAARNT